MAKDSVRLFRDSMLLGLGVCLLFGSSTIIDGLYAIGLWPRLSPEEVLERLQEHSTRVSECAYGTNGWDYICHLHVRPEGRQFFDKVGVQGGPYGIASWTELRPGPIPSREALHSAHPHGAQAP